MINIKTRETKLDLRLSMCIVTISNISMNTHIREKCICI